MALARKAPNLLALNPDIAIVQECSKKSVDVPHGHGLSGRWFGANPNKGLAVFCSAEFKLEGVDKLFGKWVVPVRVHGAVVDFNLPAIWACPVGTRRTDNYIGEVHRCLVLNIVVGSGNAPAVAAGDFNSNGQSGREPAPDRTTPG